MADWLSTGLKKIATPLQEKAKTLRDQTVQEMKSPKANTSSKIVLGVPLPKVPKEQQQKNLKAVVDVAKKTSEIISAPIKPVVDQFQKAQQTAVQVGQTIAPVLEGAGEVLNKTIIKPVSEAAAPVYKQAVNVLTDKIKPITDAARITLDAVKPFGDVVKDIGKFVTNPPTLKVTDNLKTGLEVQDRINKVLKGQWIDLINQPTITEDVAKTGAKAGLTTMGFAVDIIERPLRKTVLPYYFQTVTLAAKLGEKGYLTDQDIEDSKLSSEIWAGGSLEGANKTATFVGKNILGAMFPALSGLNTDEVTDLVEYHMDTETKFREGAYQRMADRYGISKDEVKAGIDSQTIFGVPVLNVMDTFISYSASLAEARLAPVLKSIGLEKAGDVLEFVSKAVYPTALTTLGVDQAMQTGFLGDKYRAGLYETLGGDDKNLQQNIAVLEGIAVLGTIFKAAGKAVDGIKALSLLDTANKYKTDIQKWNQDPALIKKVLQNAMPEYVKTVEDLTKGKLTVDDLTKFREVLLSLPPEVQKAAQEVNLKLFYKNMFDAAIAGYANSANKSLYLEADTLRTKVGNGIEAKGTIPHELAHLFEKGITESPEYKTEWESLVKSKKFSNSWNYGKGGVDGYMYKNPAEYFAEGVRKFINQPEVLKVEDKGLYDFMAKTSNEWGKMFNPPEFRAASPRDILETPIMQSVLKSRGEQIDPYAAADRLFKVENPKELIQGVPKALVPYAIPLREYPTMESWISALEGNEVKGLPYFGSAFPETQLRLFDGLNKVGGEKYVSAGDFYDQVKMKQWRTDVKAFETKEGVYDLNYKSPEKLSAHGVLGQSDFMPRQFDYKSIFRTGVNEFSKYQELGVTARERFKIPELVKIGQGSDRVVFDAGDYVIKVSKSSRGLAQNEGNYVAEQLGLIPQIVEKGKNYVVVEKVEVPDANVRAMVKELKGVDVETNKEAAYAILTKYGLNGEEIKKFDPMIGDMKRLSSWGTKDGKPILLDEGSLNGKLVEMYANQKNLNDPEFRSIYKESKDFKKQFGDTDKNTMFMPREDLVDREMRLDKFNVGGKQEVAIEKIVEDLGLDVRSVKHFAEMEAGAQELLQTPEKLLMTANPKRLTDVETVALKQLVNDNYGFITQAEKILARNESTDPRLLQSKIDHAYDQITRSIQILAPGLTEQGRAVVANRIMASKTMDYSTWAVRAQKLLGEDVKDEKLKIVLDQVRLLTEAKDRLGLSNLMSSLGESTFVDKLVTLWKAGLLTAPSTHIRNVLSNSAFATLETIKDIPATMIDKMASAFTGKRTVTFTSLADRFEGIPKGWLMAQDVMKYGSTLDDLGKSEIYKKVNFSDSPLGSIADKYTKFVFNTLQAEDAIFKGMAENAALKQSAKVVAINEGLKGKSFDLRVSELMDKPTAEMKAFADEYKYFATFNNKNILSDMASKARTAAANNPASQVVVESAIPFVRTPTNVAMRTMDYSPIGIVKGLYEAVLGKQQAAVMDLGRGITGSAIIALGALAAQKGLMTGTYPTKGDEKKKFANLGLRGGDLIVGDKALNIMNISPIGNLMQLGASLYNNTKDQGAAGLQATAFDGLKGLTEQTFLAGLSNLLKAAQDPQQSASTYFSSAISGMVPTVLAQLAESTDIYQRETNALTDRLLSRTPARSMLLPKLDTFGEPVESNQQKLLGSSSSFVSRALVRMFDPFGVRKLPDNVLLDEYERLSDMGIEKAYPATPSEKGTISILKDDGTKEKLEFKMSDETYNVFREVTGKLMTSAQEELLQSPEYQALDDDTKAKKLYDIYETSRDTAKALVMPLIFDQSEVQAEASKLFTQERIKDIRLELREGRPTEAVQFVPLMPRNKKVQDLVFN